MNERKHYSIETIRIFLISRKDNFKKIDNLDSCQQTEWCNPVKWNKIPGRISINFSFNSDELHILYEVFLWIRTIDWHLILISFQWDYHWIIIIAINYNC